MRWIALLLPLALVACNAPDGAVEPAVASVPEAPRLDFTGKRRIPVRLEMLATADGGRAVPIAGAWRGQVEFDGGDSSQCAIARGALEEIAPGSRHEVGLVCGAAVRLPEDGSRGFRVLEDGRVIASGTVLP